MFSALAFAVTLVVSPVPFGLFEPPSGDVSLTAGASFTPDGATVYYAKSQPGYNGLTIFASHRTGTTWSQPEVAFFSGTYRDTDPFVTPDGRAVLFASTRPLGDAAGDYKLWIAYLSGPKRGRVEALPASVNRAGMELHPSVARDGTLYFSRIVDGTTRIEAATRSGDGYATPEALAFPDDAPHVSDGDPAIAPDASFLIFSSNRPTAHGPSGLFASRHAGGRWCAPVAIGAPVSTGLEFDPELSDDGATLYFASARTSLVAPRAQPADAASFKAELAAYAHGTVRTYMVPVADWIRESATCGGAPSQQR